MLYHPSHIQHYDPIRLKLKHEEVYFHSADNVRLHGWYLKSKNPKGIIVFFHGNGENLSSHFASMAWILKHNYDYFIFDYRGYGKSHGKPTPEGTVKDGQAAIAWAEQRRKEKGIELPLIVLGQSLGGAVALRTVYELRGQPKVSLVIAESTFPSYQSVGRKVLSKSWFLWPFQWLPYLLLSDEWAPKKYIKDLSPIPLVVLHGDKDPVVDFTFGKEIFKLAKHPKEFWPVPGGRHTDAFWRHDGRYQQRLLVRLEQLQKEYR